MNNAFKWLFSAVVGGLAGFFNRYGILSLLVCGAVLLDIVTGLLKAKTAKEINSNAGFTGFWRKLSLFAGLFFGYLLDYLNGYLLSVSDMWSFSSDIPFGIFIGIYIVLNECISILENLYACGVTLPAFIIKSLKTAREHTNKEQKNK